MKVKQATDGQIITVKQKQNWGSSLHLKKNIFNTICCTNIIETFIMASTNTPTHLHMWEMAFFSLDVLLKTHIHAPQSIKYNRQFLFWLNRAKNKEKSLVIFKIVMLNVRQIT